MKGRLANALGERIGELNFAARAAIFLGEFQPASQEFGMVVEPTTAMGMELMWLARYLGPPMGLQKMLS